jgi:hypothetical protein
MRETKRGETIPSQSPKRPGTKPGSMHIDKRAGRLLADPISEGEDDDMLTTEEVADWLGVSTQFLELLRGRGTGPGFVDISPRIKKYRREAVRQWLRSRERRSTAQYQRKP